LGKDEAGGSDRKDEEGFWTHTGKDAPRAP
jgi:hypothetical protein